MSVDFASRLLGMVIFALVGARMGVDSAATLALPPLATSFIFALLWMLFGRIITPYITVRPLRIASRIINEMPMEVLFTGFIGLVIGLGLALLVAYPLSLLPSPFGSFLPPLISAV